MSQFHNHAPHHPGHTAAVYRRGDQSLPSLHEQIGHGAFHDSARIVQHQTFGYVGIVPFPTGQHLFQSIEMLEPGDRTAHRKPRIAKSDAYAL